MGKYQPESWASKSEKILTELSEGRVALSRVMPLDEISKALSADFSEGKARDIAFHLCDWNREAQFLIALQMAPDRFTPKEIREGITACVIHIPNHVAAAAALAGWPMQDVFKVGAKIEQADSEEK